MNKKQGFWSKFFWGEDQYCPDCGNVLSPGEIAGCYGGCFACFREEQENKMDRAARMTMEAEKFKLLFDTSKEVMLAFIKNRVAPPSPSALAILAVEYSKELALECEREIKKGKEK